jgi:hypothetical protein
VYDPRPDHLVLVFGRDDATFFGDAAVFDLAASAWNASPPSLAPAG